MVATLLTEMDGIDAHVMVIGATNRPNALDPALRRAGRFDTELVIGVPSEEGRREILGILTRKQVGQRSHADKLRDKRRSPTGCVDLDNGEHHHGICWRRPGKPVQQKRCKCNHPGCRDIDLEQTTCQLSSTRTSRWECQISERTARRYALGLEGVCGGEASVTFDDIGGLEDVKRELMEMIEFGEDNDGYFDAMGIKPPSGCMFYGPPGCSKTLMAKAMASEMESNFVSIKGPELSSKWFESEENLRSIFEKGRQASPCILFFDEMDSLAKKRGMARMQVSETAWSISS